MSIYPTLNHEPLYARQVTNSTANILTEPQSNDLAAAAYSEWIGFSGSPFNANLSLKANAGGGDAVAIEICRDISSAVASAHPDSPISIDGLLQFQIVNFGLEGSPGFWRIRNTATIAVTVSFFRLPNRR